MQKIEYISVDKIKLDPKNPRIIKDDQFKKLCKSIKENAQYFETRPILVDKNMVIFAGNMRYRAAVEVGLKEVPVAIMDITDEKRKELLIRDNIQNGNWDWDILANDFDNDFLQDLGLDNLNLEFKDVVDNLENGIFMDSIKNNSELFAITLTFNKKYKVDVEKAFKDKRKEYFVSLILKDILGENYA